MSQPHPPAPRPRRSRRARADRETKGTVVVALLANMVIAVAKTVAGVVAPSPALMAEAAHSVADSLNEVFLLFSLSRSRRRADVRHPFGYGKERFFWSLLAAVGIFVTGGCFSFYQGLHTWLSPPSEAENFGMVYLVLIVALLAEGTSLARALFQLHRQARARGCTLAQQIRRAEDPTVRTVLAEDSTAVFGVLLAAGGVAGHQITGSPTWEAVAALAIGALLIGVAVRLGHEARSLLVGQAVDPRLQQQAHTLLAEQKEIDTVTTLLTMRLGADSALLAARVDLQEGLDSEEVEEVCVRIKRQLREECPAFDQVFLDIVDADSNDRARARTLERDLDRVVAEQDGSDE
ncbi:cation diffusion facilitator family transporter [Kitasatospora sp. NBC_00374]|uniref:cation diffusion facilitator family transporter n=1 Tax=Kitasatospora sp. NBC_00374 TaxID=2975964 RepID=UPI0030E444EE